jgi:hypothetical protein
MRGDMNDSTEDTNFDVLPTRTVVRSDLMDVAGPLLAGALAIVILGCWTRSRLAHADEVAAPARAIVSIR